MKIPSSYPIEVSKLKIDVNKKLLVISIPKDSDEKVLYINFPKLIDESSAIAKYYKKTRTITLKASVLA